MSASELIGSGVRIPATTSSPWLLARNSPNSPGSPVAGLRVNTTPEPESADKLPNTMDCTTTAVPRSCAMRSRFRYAMARGPFQLRKTASMAPRSWAAGSWGNGWPVWRSTICW